MNDVTRILDELREVDERLGTVGSFVDGQRDSLLAQRRRLEAEFDAIRLRPAYLEQITALADRTRADLIENPVTRPFSLEELRSGSPSDDAPVLGAA